MDSSRKKLTKMVSGEGFEALPNVRSKVVKREKPKVEQMERSEKRKPHQKAALPKKKKHQLFSADEELSSNHWKNYGHFF